MDDLGRLIEEHGRYWFEMVGGADWRSDLVMGLDTLVVVFSLLAILLSVIVMVSGDRSE